MTATATPAPDIADLIEALAHLVRRAKREMPKVGATGHPTPWDRRHAEIDHLLDDLVGR